MFKKRSFFESIRVRIVALALAVFCTFLAAAPTPVFALPDGYMEITPNNTTSYPVTLNGYKQMTFNGSNMIVVSGASGNPDYYRFKLADTCDKLSGSMYFVSDQFANGRASSITTSNDSQGYVLTCPTSTNNLYVSIRDLSKFTNESEARAYFDAHPLTVLFRPLDENATNNTYRAVRRGSDGALGYYCESGTDAGKFVIAADMTTSTPLPCRNLFNKNQTYLNAYVDKNNGKITQGTTQYCFVIPVEPNTTYTLSGMFAASVWGTFTSDAIGTTATNKKAGNGTVTTGANDRYLIGLAYASGTQYDYRDTLQVEEGSTATTYVPYCDSEIRIATTKYVADAFAPVQAELDSTVNTIRGIVRDNKTQAQMVNQIQNEKQTRPDGDCPLYRQCLLVTDENGNPNWYPILDPFYDLFRPVTAVNASATGTTSHVGYTQLEYLQSSGTQYIDTGVAGNMGIKADLDFSVSNAVSTNFLLASRKIAGQDTRFYLCTFSIGGVAQHDIALGRDSFSPTVVANQRYNYVMDTTVSPATLVIDGGQTITNNNSYNTNLNMYLFASNTAGEASFGGATPIRIYYAKIWDGNTMVRDFVPARRDGDGVLGMYDTVTGRFFTNAGSGTFTAGPDVTNVPAEWTATFAADATNNIIAGTISGTATCNATTGTANTIATSAQLSNANWSATGANCWCRALRADYTNGQAGVTSSQRWVYLPMADGHACATDCAADCATAVGTGANSAFRSAMSGI